MAVVVAKQKTRAAVADKPHFLTKALFPCNVDLIRIKNKRSWKREKLQKNEPP